MGIGLGLEFGLVVGVGVEVGRCSKRCVRGFGFALELQIQLGSRVDVA